MEKVYPVVMAIKHIANDTPVSKERLIAANTIGRSRVKQIVLKYGFTNAISNFVDFKILLIIVTFLACKHYNFINGGRINGQVRETANIFGFHQSLKSRRECTNTSRLIFQIIGQFLNSTFYNAEHIYKIIFAASKVQLAITDVGNIIGCTLQIACDMGGEQNTMLEKLKKAGHDDAFITYSGTSGGTSARKITTGSKVRVKAGAKTYSGGSLASFVYSRDHIVKELSGKRAVITYGGTVVAAVNVDDLTLV